MSRYSKAGHVGAECPWSTAGGQRRRLGQGPTVPLDYRRPPWEFGRFQKALELRRHTYTPHSCRLSYEASCPPGGYRSWIHRSGGTVGFLPPRGYPAPAAALGSFDKLPFAIFCCWPSQRNCSQQAAGVFLPPANPPNLGDQTVPLYGVHTPAPVRTWPLPPPPGSSSRSLCPSCQLPPPAAYRS